MEKKTVINTSVCDVRNVSEKTLAAYGELSINTALLLANSRSRALLAQYSVTLNCAKVLDVEGDVQVSTVNGSVQIKSTDVPTGKRFLIVNGSLGIGPDTQRALEQYVGILVNGSVTYPESLSGALGMLTVNGSTTCYPDGAVVLKRKAVIDRLFVLRAREALYWAGKRLIMVDPKLDPAALEAKGAKFSAPEAILAESKVEGLIGLLDEKADIIIVPDGTAVVQDDVALDSGTLKKYGSKLYITGDLTVEQEGAAALEGLEYLNVRGDVLVAENLKDLLMEKAQEIEGEVTVLKARGLTLRDQPMVRVTRRMLEREPEGVLVMDCAIAKLDEDVEEQLILERLSISDCAMVKCTREQEDAVTAVSQDVAQIGGEEEGGFGLPDDDAKAINAAEYVL